MRPDDDRRALIFEPDAAPGWLPIPRRALALVSAAFAALLLALSLLHVHGFSLPCWHEVIDRSPAPEVLLGRPRLMRSDDWVVGLTTILSQSAQQPSFPVMNRLIGDSAANVLVGASAPVRHPVSVFRPQLWGYFLGDDFGLAWNWWFRILALVYSLWLAFSLLSGGRTVLAMLAAIALLFSPFFQFWSMNSEPMGAMMALAFVASSGVALCRSVGRIVLWGVLLAWAGGCFALSVVYPPSQVSLAYLFVFLLGGWIVRERARIAAARRFRVRILIAAAAAVLVALAIASWAVSAREALNLLAGTIYPGRRSVLGGDLTPFRALNNIFTFGVWHQRLTPIGNICEGAGFYLVFPLVLGCALAARILWRRKLDPVVAAVGAYLVLLSLHALVGVPEPLAHLTLLDRVEGIRAVIGLGIGDVTLWIAWMARPGGAFAVAAANASSRGERVLVLALATAWGACLFALGVANHRLLPETSTVQIAATVLLFTGLGAAIAARWKGAVAALVSASFLATAWFNPVVRGGASFLSDNPLSREIVSLDRSRGGGTRWVVYNDRVLSNLFRAIGVHSLGGVHPYPQLGLWSRLDPDGRFAYAYNRYAHVAFMLPRSPDELQIVASQRDVVDVYLDPASAQFASLGADFVLFPGDGGPALAASPALEKVASSGNRTIYAVVRGAASRDR